MACLSARVGSHGPCWGESSTNGVRVGRAAEALGGATNIVWDLRPVSALHPLRVAQVSAYGERTERDRPHGHHNPAQGAPSCTAESDVARLHQPV